MKSIPVFENKYRMLPGEKQKEIPVRIRNFRSPAGLPFPPLPGESGYSYEAGSLAGRQARCFAGCAYGGGVAHAASRAARLASVTNSRTLNFTPLEWGYFATYAARRSRPAIPAFWAANSGRPSRAMAMIWRWFMTDSFKTGLRNAALCD